MRYLVEAAKLTQLRLPVALAAGIPDFKITNQAVLSVTREFGLHERAETLYKTSAGRRPVLDLHAAALVATLTDAGLAERGTGTVRSDIRDIGAGLDQLLDHEQQCWYQGAQDHGLTKAGEKAAGKMLRQIIAVCWLFGAVTGDEASELAARVPGASPSAAMTEWLRKIFERQAQPNGRGRMQTPQPPRGTPCHTGARDLTRTRPGMPDRPGHPAGPAGRGLPGPGVRRLRERSRPAETGPGRHRRPPGRTGITGRDADGRAQRPARPEPIAGSGREGPEPADPGPAACLGPSLAARAYWLAGLSSRLSTPDERAEAVAAAQEAASSYGELAAGSAQRYRPEQATALNNLGIRLSEAGRLDEARSATEAAVALYRQLVAADPGLYAPALASAVANLGYRYQRLGRASDALSAAEEAVATYREVDAGRPGLYASYFAFALTTLASRYAGADRPADALPRQEEAIAIYRDLSATKRGDSASRPGRRAGHPGHLPGQGRPTRRCLDCREKKLSPCSGSCVRTTRSSTVQGMPPP